MMRRRSAIAVPSMPIRPGRTTGGVSITINGDGQAEHGDMIRMSEWTRDSLSDSSSRTVSTSRCLERGEWPELAMNVLRRYTTSRCGEVGERRAWLEACRDRLFSLDAGGYKHLVAPESLGRRTDRSQGRTAKPIPAPPRAGATSG